MWIQNFYKSLIATSALRRPTRRVASPLCLEPLEDRTVPAFLAAVNYSLEWSAEAVASADFNRDGWLDLVTATSILLGNGDGTFQPARSLSPVMSPQVAAVGDFSGDGNPDLATGTSVSLGNGDGSFGEPLEFGGSGSVEVGDLNGDGKDDLVTISWGNDELSETYFSVFLANGDGTFAPPWSVETHGLLLAVADFNDDGMLDVAGVISGNVAVRLGNGDGTLRPPVTSDVALDYFAVGRVADFNGDGKPDLVITGGYPSADVSILVGNGDGTFQPAQAYGNGTSLFNSGMADGDFNGDGKADVAVTHDGSVSILLGNGDGTLALPTNFHTGFSGQGVTAGDFNGDGFSDLAGTGYPGVIVLVNDVNWPPVGAPSASVSSATFTEGNTGTRVVTFTVTLSAASGQPVTISYATVDGSAAAGSDYQAVSDTLVIPVGQTTGTIPVLINGDRLGEPHEHFFVNLSNATNASIADGQGLAVIMDDEPRISISDVTKYEGKRGKTTFFAFTVTLSAAYDQAVTVSFRTANGTATTSNNDYIGKTGTLTFAPGETTKTITIAVKGDSKREANETFYLDLFGNSSNALFTNNRGLGTILNDD